jgi:hypothetical protein
MEEAKFVLVPEKDSWKLESNGKLFNIFWLQGCPDIVLDQMLEKELGFIPKKGNIDLLRYPKQYEFIATPRGRDE